MGTFVPYKNTVVPFVVTDRTDPDNPIQTITPDFTFALDDPTNPAAALRIAPATGIFFKFGGSDVVASAADLPISASFVAEYGVPPGATHIALHRDIGAGVASFIEGVIRS